MTSLKLVAQYEVNGKCYLIYETGIYNPKTSQLPNTLPYDPSRYMHRHRGKGVKNGS